MTIKLDFSISLDDILDLPSVDFDDVKHLPDSAGLYFVLAVIDSEMRLIYVGKTDISFNLRWQNHHRVPEIAVLRKLGIPVYVAWMEMECDRRFLSVWEGLIVQRFQPVFNNSPTIGRQPARPAKIHASEVMDIDLSKNSEKSVETKLLFWLENAGRQYAEDELIYKETIYRRFRYKSGGKTCSLTLGEAQRYMKRLEDMNAVKTARGPKGRAIKIDPLH